jgi:DNA-binding LacI/PurR family transcriptional regulator
VAKAADVSMMTVSRVLKDSPHVSQSTRERVLAEITHLGYRPNFSARTLRAGESRLIGILAPELMIPLHVEILQGARDAAAEHGFRLMLLFDSPDSHMGNSFATDGDLILSRRDGEAHDPHRTVSLMGGSTEVDECGTDLSRVTREAFLHLYSLGYRRMGLIQLKGNTPRLGWCEALKEKGLPENPDLVQEVGLEPESVIDGIRNLVAQDHELDAVAIVHTAGTPHGLEELQQQGYRLGFDIGVVGTELGDSGWSSVLSPKLTTIQIPGYEIGWAGAMRLLDRLQGDASPPRQVSIPSRLVIRESTPEWKGRATAPRSSRDP